MNIRKEAKLGILLKRKFRTIKLFSKFGNGPIFVIIICNCFCNFPKLCNKAFPGSDYSRVFFNTIFVIVVNSK